MVPSTTFHQVNFYSFHLEPQAEFKARVILVRESMEMKEQEVTGQWLTEEKMVKSGDYTAQLGLSDNARCHVCTCACMHTAFLQNKKSDFEPPKEYHCQGDCILQSVPLRSRAAILPCLCLFECLLF